MALIAQIYVISLHDMRIITDLNEASIDALKWLCENYKISRAEAIRRAVMEKAEHEMEVEKNKKKKKEEALKASFGMWKDSGVTTSTYLDEARKVA